MSLFRFECRYESSQSGVDFTQEIEAPCLDNARMMAAEARTDEHFVIVKEREWHEELGCWLIAKG